MKNKYFTIPLVPVFGSTFQPTGFPDLGPGEFSLPTGEKMLRVESVQSMANRLELVCWDEKNQHLVPALSGMPYISVKDSKGEEITNTILEAHRINSVYVQKTKFWNTFNDEVGFNKNQPYDFHKLYEALFRYDPNSLIHGVFLESIAGVLRVPRALASKIEAKDVQEDVSAGGVKFDRVKSSSNKEDKEDASTGFGHIPFSKSEYSAREIKAFFAIYSNQLDNYKLGEEETEFLETLCFFKIRSFLDGNLRLRSSCDFKITKEPDEIPSLEFLTDLVQTQISKLKPKWKWEVTSTVYEKQKKTNRQKKKESNK